MVLLAVPRTARRRAQAGPSSRASRHCRSHALAHFSLKSPDYPDARLPTRFSWRRFDLAGAEARKCRGQIPSRPDRKSAPRRPRRTRLRNAPRPAAAGSCRSRARPSARRRPRTACPWDDEKTRSSVCGPAAWSAAGTNSVPSSCPAIMRASACFFLPEAMTSGMPERMAIFAAWIFEAIPPTAVALSVPPASFSSARVDLFD